MLVLQHVRLLSNVLTTGEVFTLLNVFEVEESLMRSTNVVCPKVDRRTVCSHGMHDVDHDLWDINFLSFWE